MSKTAYEIQMERLEKGLISQKEFDRQERWETIRGLGIILGGMLLTIILFKETDLGRAFDTLFVSLLYLVGILILGFVVIGGAVSVVLSIARPPQDEKDRHDV